MKNLLFLSILFLLNGCFFSSVRDYNRINTFEDEFKKEEISYLRFYKKAYELNKRNRVYFDTDLRFERKKSGDLSFPVLKMKMTLNPLQNLDSVFYIKTGLQVFHLKFNQIKSAVTHISNTSQETKIIKEKPEDDKDKNEKETVIHSSSTVNRELMPVKTKTILDKQLLDELQKTTILEIRYYVDEIPYTIYFKPKEIAKIRELFAETHE